MQRPNRLLCWSLGALAFVSGCADESAVDPEVQAVLDAAVDDPAGVTVYRFDGQLHAGDIIEPVARGEEDPELSIVVEADSELYFVDEHPDALFGHPAKYVLVDADTGEMTVHEAQMWPSINGEAFAPFVNDPVHGSARQAEAPVDLELEQEIGFRQGDAMCARKNYAITIDGAGRVVNTDLAEDVMRQTLESRGYIVERVQYQGTAAKTKAAALAAIAKLGALPDDTIGELIIYYVGHGVKGSWVFGHNDTAVLGHIDLGKALKKIDADDRTVIVDACHSGFLADHAELVLQDLSGVDEERVRVLTAASADEFAVVKPAEALAGTLFTEALTVQMIDKPADEWDFDDPNLFKVGAITTTVNGKANTQTPQSKVVDPDEPRLLTYEHEGRCDVAGHIEVQDYSREARFEGEWFGDADGHIELQDKDGTWHQLQTIYWGKDNAIAPIPMRADGFPSTGKSKDAAADVPAGYYLARAVKADGNKSPTSEVYLVKVELQVYENMWSPNYAEYDHPAWNEMWHPFTKGDFTNGPTIQQSYVRIPSDGAVDLTKLDSNTDAEHWVSEYLEWDTFGDWSYELPPGERDLATAHDQRHPEFNYYGFRAGFAEDYSDTQTWIYLLAYD